MATQNQEVIKDMIIKLHLPDSTLQTLLNLAKSADTTLPELFLMFIEDLADSRSEAASILEDWFYLHTSPQKKVEEDADQTVHFSSRQIEIMNLIDVINQN